MARSTASDFHEEQPFSERRLRLAIAVLPLLITLLAAARATLPRWPSRLPVSTGDLAFLAVLLWIVYAWLARVRLVTDVSAEGIAVGLRGLFWHDRVPAGGWRSASLATFDAAREFGGYGLRRVGALRAYVASGSRGVRIELTDGSVLLLGSDRAADLLAALNRAAGRPR